jgi:Sulfotransferase domain
VRKRANQEPHLSFFVSQAECVSEQTQLPLPDFIGIGPPRTGTTWLHKALEPVVVLPHGTKETHFFSRRYDRGIHWYADHFRHGAQGLPIGEFDPNFFNRKALERIHRHLPHCRLICTMRDPVDRAYSFYKHLRRMGCAADFEAWLPHMRGGNRYATYLRLWLERFGRDQILITFYDDLEADAQSYVDKVCDFIGAGHVDLTQFPRDRNARNHVEREPRSVSLARYASLLRRTLKKHRAYSVSKFLSRTGVWTFCGEGGRPYAPLSREVEHRTRQRFLPEVEALEELLHCDLTRWKHPQQRND